VEQQYVAIKIIKYSDRQLNLDLVDNEVNILTSIKSPNIVHIIEYMKKAEYVKKNGGKYQCVAIVLELMSNGDLYDYIAEAGRFSESIARAFFKLLVSTLK